MQFGGVWIPLITPFRDGHVDLDSTRSLVEHLVPKGIAGLIVGATTGESLSLRAHEEQLLLRAVKDTVRGRLPVFAGAGAADTRAAIDAVKRAEDAGAEGVLSVCPFFNRPDQRGILSHFEALAACTRLPVVLYNNPARTGTKMHNETIRRLATIDNVIGLKDCCGDVLQSQELLLDPPLGCSILTGEDALFFPMLALGAKGAILASAHWATESFVEVWRATEQNDLRRARQRWTALLPATRLFFEEPSPAPIKYVLQHAGQIASDEVRQPLVRPTEALKRRLAELSPPKADTLDA